MYAGVENRYRAGAYIEAIAQNGKRGGAHEMSVTAFFYREGEKDGGVE
jgi:hypothetical protein